MLAIDPELTKIALARARDMTAKNYLAHAAPIPGAGENAVQLVRDIVCCLRRHVVGEP